MNSIEMMAQLDKIAAGKSAKDRVPMLTKLLEDPFFKRVCNAAYNPFVTFGIKPQRVTGRGKEGFTDETWKLLSDLANRRVTGNAAKSACDLMMDSLDAQSAELFWRITNSDLKSGFTEGSLNKALKGFIPEFPYMRCSLPKDVDLGSWEWQEGIISQVKADGRYTNVNIEADGNVSMTSRQGIPLPIEKFARIEADLKTFAPRGTQCHGEMLVMRDGKILPRQTGNGLITEVVEGGSFAEGDTPILQLWDCIPLSVVKPKAVYDSVPYAQRLAEIIKAFGNCETVHIVETKVVRSIADAVTHFIDAVNRGLEGTVVKRKRGVWKDTGSSGSKDQVKMKIDAEVELKVVGYREGKEGSKRAASIGALICQTSDGLLEVGAGSGLKDKDLEYFGARAAAGETGDIVCIRFNDLMEPSESNPLHSLFLPRYIERRTDKSEADSLEQVRAIFAEAKTGQALIESTKGKK